ncbi:hypothetical protein FJ960_28070 [Mesorhizobium sp. B2-3-11]|nr:hypothetical protein FJ960_28070 [Mesorhizobium sp. B2-3-11]
MGALTPELGRLSHEFLGAVERRGSVSLELLATGRYFDRLMDNSKVVRYLAHNFPANLTSFTACRCPASSHQFAFGVMLLTFARWPHSQPENASIQRPGPCM